MRQLPKFLLALTTVVIISLISQTVLSQQWRPVRGGIAFGISGMVLLEQQNDSYSFLVVHDNKDQTLGRLAIVTIKGNQPPQYSPVNWPNETELPIDLESITTVPDTSPPAFMAATSAGNVYYFRLDSSQKNASILKVFSLPNIPTKSNFEGFTLQKINNQLLVTWAHRGQDREPSILYWGQLNPKTYQITPLGSTPLQVPFPISAVRHISDIKVDSSGVLFISAASDNGDNGPFDSAVYVGGAFGISDRTITFQLNSQLVPLYRFNYHKIEAIELVPGKNGGIIVGSDDENMGSSVYLNW